jgi:hypothetical protein
MGQRFQLGIRWGILVILGRILYLVTGGGWIVGLAWENVVSEKRDARGSSRSEGERDQM